MDGGKPMEVAREQRSSMDAKIMSAQSDPLPAPLSSSIGSKYDRPKEYTSTIVTPFQSRIPMIWETFFHRMERIDQLEKRIEKHISRKRRRILNILEQLPSHRRSTVRIFVTHQFDRYAGIWTLVIEGKLLIGNLDHASAARVNKEGVMSVRVETEDDHCESKSKDAKDTSSTSHAMKSPSTIAASLTPDRHQYKIGAEEEDPVEPITFTYLFDRVDVTFRTIYQPRSAPTTSYAAPGEISPIKKSRSAKRKTNQPEAVVEVDPSLLMASAPTKLVWNKGTTTATSTTTATQSSPSTPSSSNPDAHAFWFQYNNHFSERPPPPNMKFHSIAAEIKLYPTRPNVVHQYDHDSNSEPIYQIVNASFRDSIFGGKYGVSTSKPKIDDTNVGQKEESILTTSNPSIIPGVTGSLDYNIPLDNDIHIPLFLSYNEIVMALFRYIQYHNLHDPADKSLIICDKLLTDLFGVESINFGYIRPLLFEKKLIKAVAKERSTQPLSLVLGASQRQGPPDPVAPVRVTYVMNDRSTSAQVPLGFREELITPSVPTTGRRPISGGVAEVIDDPYHAPTVLSFDMEVGIPSLFNPRTRDLLLNVKKREFEYTTCRTKARYMLVAGKGNEDAVKTKIEQSISGQGFIPENTPVFLALARAAHPHSEARSAAQIDARMCDLIGRVEESNRKAISAWEAVEAMRRGIGLEITSLGEKESDSEEDDTIQ
jgi:hypothetical protein